MDAIKFVQQKKEELSKVDKDKDNEGSDLSIQRAARNHLTKSNPNSNETIKYSNLLSIVNLNFDSIWVVYKN